jgi:peptide/nickel transport system permease protein
VSQTPPLVASGVLAGPVRQPGAAAGLLAAFPMILALTIIGGLVLAGYFLPLPYNPIHPNVYQLQLPPSRAHLFGTDDAGFDVFSRIIAASDHDLPLAMVGTLFAAAIGVPLGLLASSRGTLGGGIMRIVDAFQAFPVLVVAVVLVTLAGNHLENVVFAIGIINVPRFIRLVRSESLVLRASRFVEAAIAVGNPPARVLLIHVLPNVAATALAQAALSAANAIIVIAGLNFLGVGVSPPEPTWGSMLATGAHTIAQGVWWMTVFPALAILLSVLAFNVLADSVGQLMRVAD